jgi:regulator of sigma D
MDDEKRREIVLAFNVVKTVCKEDKRQDLMQHALKVIGDSLNAYMGVEDKPEK